MQEIDSGMVIKKLPEWEKYAQLIIVVIVNPEILCVFG